MTIILISYTTLNSTDVFTEDGSPYEGGPLTDGMALYKVSFSFIYLVFILNN